MKRLTTLLLALALCIGVGAVNASAVAMGSDYLIGDVNFDGEVTSLDAAKVLKYDSWLVDFDDGLCWNGDVNVDGVVDSLDAAQILRYDAGIINNFGPVVEDDSDEENLIGTWHTFWGDMYFEIVFEENGYGTATLDTEVHYIEWYIVNNALNAVYEDDDGVLSLFNMASFDVIGDKFYVTVGTGEILAFRKEGGITGPDIEDDIDEEDLIGTWHTFWGDMYFEIVFEENGYGTATLDTEVHYIEWYIADNALNAVYEDDIGVLSLFNMASFDVIDDKFCVIVGTGETLAFRKEEEIVLPQNPFEIPDNAEFDSALIGSWVHVEVGGEDIVTLVFAENGSGAVIFGGVIDMNMEWYTDNGVLSAWSVGWSGDRTSIYNLCDYTFEGDYLIITYIDGLDVITDIFTKIA